MQCNISQLVECAPEGERKKRTSLSDYYDDKMCASAKIHFLEKQILLFITAHKG
jgi:hypothetical protein